MKQAVLFYKSNKPDVQLTNDGRLFTFFLGACPPNVYWADGSTRKNRLCQHHFTIRRCMPRWLRHHLLPSRLTGCKAVTGTTTKTNYCDVNCCCSAVVTLMMMSLFSIPNKVYRRNSSSCWSQPGGKGRPRHHHHLRACLWRDLQWRLTSISVSMSVSVYLLQTPWCMVIVIVLRVWFGLHSCGIVQLLPTLLRVYNW